MRLSNIRLPSMRFMTRHWHFFRIHYDLLGAVRVGYALLMVAAFCTTCTWANCDPSRFQDVEQDKIDGSLDRKSYCLSRFHDAKKCEEFDYLAEILQKH